jgi:hypothetical protein
MVSKNLYRTITEPKGSLHVHKICHEAINTNRATKKFPKEFLCTFFLKILLRVTVYMAHDGGFEAENS